MIIPKKIKIASHIFKVLCPYKFQERDDIFGRIDLATNTIYITTDSNGSPCSVTHTAATFFHELIHGLDRLYCSNNIGEEGDKEDLIEGLSQGLAQVLADNFEPLVPKEKID